MNKNPYISRLPLFQPGTSLTWFDGGCDSLEVRYAKFARRGSLANKVLVVLQRFGVPVLRRVIEAVLVHNHGHRPESVTDALETVREVVWWKSLWLAGRDKPADDVYALHEPTSSSIAHLSTMYLKREEILSPHLLGNAGERYVRGAIHKTGQYNRLTQIGRLGGATNGLDVVATHRETGTPFAVEVKNKSEHLHGGSHYFGELLRKVKDTDLSPMLVTTYATATGINHARNLGIRLVTTGGLIVPAEHDDLDTGKSRPMGVVLRDLRPVIGPEPILYLPKRAGRAFYPDDLLRRLSEPVHTPAADEASIAA